MNDAVKAHPKDNETLVVPFGLQFLEKKTPLQDTPVSEWEWTPEKEIGDLVASRGTTEMSGPNSGEDRDEIGWN